jgi:hypothetical protein
MVKKRKGKLMSKALKKALKEPPCKNNPYGIKCDKKLKRLLRQDQSTKAGGSIQQRQNINIRIGDLQKAKRKQARKTVATHRQHRHYTEAERATFGAPVLQTGSLLSQDEVNRAVGAGATYGQVRHDLLQAHLEETQREMDRTRRGAAGTPERAAGPAATGRGGRTGAARRSFRGGTVSDGEEEERPQSYFRRSAHHNRGSLAAMGEQIGFGQATPQRGPKRKQPYTPGSLHVSHIGSATPAAPSGSPGVITSTLRGRSGVRNHAITYGQHSAQPSTADRIAQSYIRSQQASNREIDRQVAGRLAETEAGVQAIIRDYVNKTGY